MGWPIKKKYDPLATLLPIISYEVGNCRLQEKLIVIVQDFRVLADLFVEHLKTEDAMNDYDELIQHVEAAEERIFTSMSVSFVVMECVEIYRLLGVDDPISELGKQLIGMVKDPIEALALVGRFLT